MGIVKTYHAKKRQLQRNITDEQLIKVLQYGEFEDRSEHEVVISLDGFHIYLSHDLEKIITVTAPQKQGASIKVIPSKKAKQIKKNIHDLKEKKIDEDINTFDHYMKNDFK